MKAPSRARMRRVVPGSEARRPRKSPSVSNKACKVGASGWILSPFLWLFMSKPIKIIFKGEEYLFIGRGASLEDGGTIVTEETDDEVEVYAQLHPNGLVIRLGEIIGTIKEILFIDDESEEVN
jgi:hypothetical protein